MIECQWENIEECKLGKLNSIIQLVHYKRFKELDNQTNLEAISAAAAVYKVVTGADSKTVCVNFCRAFTSGGRTETDVCFSTQEDGGLLKGLKCLL